MGRDELERVWIEYATDVACTRCPTTGIRTLSPSVNRFQAIVLGNITTEQQCHVSELHAHRVYHARSNVKCVFVYTAIGESVGRYSTKHSLRGISRLPPPLTAVSMARKLVSS
jgi:hypothetical protein